MRKRKTPTEKSTNCFQPTTKNFFDPTDWFGDFIEPHGDDISLPWEEGEFKLEAAERYACDKGWTVEFARDSRFESYFGCAIYGSKVWRVTIKTASRRKVVSEVIPCPFPDEYSRARVRRIKRAEAAWLVYWSLPKAFTKQLDEKYQRQLEQATLLWDGEIPYIRIGKRYLVDLRDGDAFIKRQKEGAR